MNVNLYFQGEPMLHPGFFSFVEECRGLKTVISTNGHFLDAGNAARLAGSSLGKLIVSLDGMDQGTYSKYRKNGRIEEVINGIKLLTDAKKHSGSGPQVIIQFLVNRYNEEQVELARKFARENGCLLSLKSMQVIDPDEAGLWMPSGKKYRRYELKDGKYAIRNTFPRYCGRLWMNPVTTWDGKVLPCCFDKDAGYVMGDLNTGSFSSIWKGERYMKFRRDLLTGREKLAMCRNCTSGLRGIKK